jgi:hypothetical protein
VCVQVCEKVLKLVLKSCDAKGVLAQPFVKRTFSAAGSSYVLVKDIFFDNECASPVGTITQTGTLTLAANSSTAEVPLLTPTPLEALPNLATGAYELNLEISNVTLQILSLQWLAFISVHFFYF